MVTHFDFNEKASAVAGHTTRGFRSVRTYGEVLLLVLLILHVVAFFSYRWIEYGEIRSELMNFSTQQHQEDFDPQSADINQYPDHIVVLHGGAQESPGFSEHTIRDEQYLFYVSPDSDLIVARAEVELDRELNRFATVLAVLYVAEVLVLYSWWGLAKEKIKDLFDVT